jgi:hypothetical protein
VGDGAGFKRRGVDIRRVRHTCVSVLSDRLVGHTGGSTVTETVYRKQLRPVIEDSATITDRDFGPTDHDGSGDRQACGHRRDGKGLNPAAPDTRRTRVR